MSLNFNKCIEAGRLTADPELKQTPNGISVTQFTIAVNRKTAPGAEQKADFLRCVAWRQTAEFICNYFVRGSAILVIGSLQNRQYTDRNGVNQTITEINVDSAEFVESRATAQQQKPQAQATPTVAAADTANFVELDADYQLPF